MEFFFFVLPVALVVKRDVLGCGVSCCPLGVFCGYNAPPRAFAFFLANTFGPNPSNVNPLRQM